MSGLRTVLVRPLRARVGTSVRASLGAGPAELDRYIEGRGDPGLFGPGSVVWRVHADLPSMLIGGLSALIAQTLHPLAMAGVAGHSRYQDDPLDRLRRTARFVAGTTFGAVPFASSLVETVRTVHGRVQGIAPDGRPYSANDPRLLCFVHSTEVYGFLSAYQAYSQRPLLRAEKDQYLSEVAVVAELLGASEVPRSVGELRSYFGAIADELELTGQAKTALSFLTTASGRTVAERVAHSVVITAATDLLAPPFRVVGGFPRLALPLRVAARAAASSLARATRFAIGPSVVASLAAERASDASPESGHLASSQYNRVPEVPGTRPG